MVVVGPRTSVIRIADAVVVRVIRVVGGTRVAAVRRPVAVHVDVVIKPGTSVASIAHAVFVTVELIGVRVLRAIIVCVADVVIVGVLELIDATREQFASVDGTRVVIVAIGLSPAGTLAIHAGVVGGAVVTVLACIRIGLVHAAGRGVT